MMIGKDFNGLLGSLLYAACMTRPDIAYATAYLCQFMQAPSTGAWEAALGVAAYLNSTSELGITFGGGQRACCVESATRLHPICISDGSFGRDPHPFVGGFVEWRNGPAVWVARKSKSTSTALSSCEIELNALVMMLKEALFVTQMVQFTGIKLVGPMPVITDNKAAYDVIKCPGATKRTAHFDRWLHFARDLRLRNAIEIFLTGTDNMMADFFTKPVDKTTFLRCRKYVLNLA